MSLGADGTGGADERLENGGPMGASIGPLPSAPIPRKKTVVCPIVAHQKLS